MMGAVIAKDLADALDVEGVIVADIDPARLRDCLRRWDHPLISAHHLAGDGEDAMLRLISEADVVAGAYPERQATRYAELAVRAGTSLVDLTALWRWEERLALDERAKEAGVTIVPGCGVAPGLSNILVGIGVGRVGRPESAVAMVGGLPQNPVPPFDYSLVFSLDTLIDEYTVPPRIVVDGQVKTVDPLSGVETVRFPEPVGECECFYTDGLTTLLETMKPWGLKFLAEKTVRYPGHVEKMGLLSRCGFFRDEPVEVDGARVVPRRVARALLEPLLTAGDPRDVTVMRVEVTGEGEPGYIAFELVDFYDEDAGITSMARTTGYVCSSVCLMVARGEIERTGVLPPETAIDEGNFTRLLEMLREKRIDIDTRE